MDMEERTDYRKATPDVLYQMRKTVISMNKRKKTVEEIIEDTGFCERTVRQIISNYKRGGMAAMKPKTRGRKTGEKRTLKPRRTPLSFVTATPRLSEAVVSPSIAMDL